MAFSHSTKSRHDWLLGICFRARRTVDGQNGDRCRGVRGSGGSEGWKKNEVHGRRCSAREISGSGMWSRRDSSVQALFVRMIIRSAVPSIFRQRFFSGAVLSVASVGIEDEDGAVVGGISTGLPEARRWSNRSKPGSASSSGIHSRIACQGGSMGSKVSSRSQS